MKNVSTYIQKMIGNTPILPFFGQNRMFCKLEGFNFSKSVKARVVFEILSAKLRGNNLHKNTVFCESTSGNTGIALLTIAKALGVKAKICMPSYLYEVKRDLFAPHLPCIECTPDHLGMQGAIERIHKLTALPCYIPLEQFTSPLNPLAQQKLGEEIAKQVPHLDFIVCGVGTGGTLMGAGGYLKKAKGVRIVAVEPSSSPFLSKGIYAPHGLYGLGAGFPPPLLDPSIIDECIAVSEEDADKMREEFFNRYSLRLGRSSGAGIYACKKVLERPENKNKVGVVICPDFV